MIIRKQSLVLSALISVITGATVHAADSSPDTDISPNFSVTNPGKSDTEIQHSSPDSRPDYAQLRRTVREYERNIAEMVKTEGAYGDRIGEELISLGLAYKELGENQKALEAFHESLHINRVNQGPDNANQLPILEQIIDINIALSDWEALDENYQLLYWASIRTYEGSNPRLLNMIYRIAQWHLNAYLKKYDPIPYKHLLESEKLFHDAVDIIVEHYDPNDPHLIVALEGIAIADYHITSHIYNSNSTDEMDEIRASSATMSRKNNVSSELVWTPVKYCNRERKKALKRIAAIYAMHPELPVEDRAVALVNLGDSYLIYGWRNNALKNYRLAYQLLADAGTDPDTINKLLREPVRIPTITMNYPDNGDNTDADKGSPYVRLSFEVTDTGCTRRIKVLEEYNTENFMARKNAKELLQSSMFRPRFEGNKAVMAREVIMKLSGDALKHKEDREHVNYEAYPNFIETKRCGHIR